MSKKRLAFYAVAILALLGLQPAQADQVFLYQSSAAIEVDQITDTSGSNLSNLQPTKSDTDARTYHDLPARVYMNGDTSTLDWIVACLYHEASLNTAGVAVDTACGYAADTSDTHTGYADSNPDKVMVVAYEHGASPSFSVKDGDSTDHVVDTANSSISFSGGDTSRQDTDSAALTTTRINIEFRFALSHAAVNDSGWKVRVSSAATSLGPDTAVGGGDDEQFRASATGSQTYGVYFFGAFSTDSERPNVNYGTLQSNSSVISTGILTGKYWSNDVVDFAMSATNFRYVSPGGDSDEIALATAADGVSGAKAMRMTCDTAANSSSDTGWTANSAVVVKSSINLADTGYTKDASDVLFSSQPASNSTGDAEALVQAPNHRCKLEYGVGATYGDQVYSNTVTIGMLDADTTDGLTAGLFGILNDGNPSQIPFITEP